MPRALSDKETARQALREYIVKLFGRLDSAEISVMSFEVDVLPDHIGPYEDPNSQAAVYYPTGQEHITLRITLHKKKN